MTDHPPRDAGALVPAAELAKAIQERDLAIAHDRQPYPTAWAYEQACKALESARRELEQARKPHPVLFDGYAVFKELRPSEQKYTSAANVAAVLDAVVRLIRGAPRDQ